MKRIAIVAAVIAALFIPTAAQAVTVTPSATTLTVGDTLTVAVSDATAFVQGGWIWQGASTTGACSAVRSGSYTNGGQVITYTCTGADVLTAVASTSGSFSLPTGTITVKAAPVVTPPPAPAAKIVTSYVRTATSYTLTITNVGNADYTGGISDAVVTPKDFTTVAAPAFTTCGNRRLLNRITHAYYNGVGFTCTGGYIPAGVSTTVSFPL